MGNPIQHKLLFLTIVAVLTVPGLCVKIVSDYRIPATAKVADFDNAASALGKLTKFKIIGENKATDAYALVQQTGGKFQSLLMKINDKSIFTPKKDDPKSAQLGFRRNDILPQYDAKSIEKGKVTYHHSFKFTKELNKAHGYLLASVEFPEADGAHIYDIFYGTPFDSKNTEGKASPEANKIRIRDINFNEIFSVDMTIGEIFNFAWDKNTIMAHFSSGDKPLVKVGKLTQNVSKNPKAAKPALKCEWHIQIIKEPLPNPADPEKDRSDVPHRGIQEKGLNEEILQLRNFAEDSTQKGFTANVDGLETADAQGKVLKKAK